MHHWMPRSVEGSDIETCKFAFDLSLDLNFGKKIPVMRMFLVLKVAWKFLLPLQGINIWDTYS